LGSPLPHVFGESLPRALSSHVLHPEEVGAFSLITKGDFYIIADTPTPTPTATPTPTPTSSSNPAAWWKFDDSNTSTIASDSSGNGNTGNLINNPTWTPGKVAGALSFNGTNQYVSVPDSASLRPGTGDFTVMAWVKTNVVNSAYHQILEKGNNTCPNYQLFLDASNKLRFVYFGPTCTPSSSIKSSTLPQSNTWYHVAAVTSRTGNTTLYVNGIAESTAAGNTSNLHTTQPLFIGAENSGGNPGNSWNGLIDDVRIYNRALFASEVQVIANFAGPVACSLYTPSTTIPSGYTSPFDVVSSPNTNLMQATCDTSSARIDLGKGDPLQYIYNQAYLFKT
jgi:hypothetical protein